MSVGQGIVLLLIAVAIIAWMEWERLAPRKAE